MAVYAAGFNAGLLSIDDAARAREHAAAIEHMAATIKALAATRVADGPRWQHDGQRSAAHELAAATGTSVKDARETIELGRRLAQQPEVSAAARRGELSPAQSQLVSDAAGADPTAAGRLLERAGDGSLAELRDEAAQTKATAGVDLEARRRAIHARRSLRAWTDPEGVWHLAATGTVEAGARIMAALGPIADRVFHDARREGRRESPSAYAFDALVELATSPHQPSEGARNTQRRGAPVKLLLRVDLDAFLRGVPAEGETCELVGYGPIPMSTVHELLETGNPFVAAILTRAKALVGVAHLGRQPTAHQQSALQWLYPACAVRGCAAQAHLQRDHRIDWADTHFTMLDLLDVLCAHHHRLKTNHGWALVPGSGKRPFVAPADPRHPRYQRPPPQQRGAA
jgi:hypothetical protein